MSYEKGVKVVHKSSAFSRLRSHFSSLTSLFFSRNSQRVTRNSREPGFAKATPGQAGNAMFMIFGAVAVVGTLSAATSTLMQGPLKTMSDVNQTTMADSNLMAASKMVMIDAANLGAADCDSDRITEAREWRAGAGPTGGGLLPNEIGTVKRDPWGTEIGYCVWDHGSITVGEAGACAEPNRLVGGNVIDQPAIAIVSAGPNATFETTCNAWADADVNDIPDTPLIVAGGDDIIVAYSYAEAAQENPGLWTMDIDIDAAGDRFVEAKLGIDAELTGSEFAVDDNFELQGTEGLLLPDETQMATCDVTTEGQIRRNTTTSPPTLELCESNTWELASTGSGSGGGITTPEDDLGQSAGLFGWGFNDANNTLGVNPTPGATAAEQSPVFYSFLDDLADVDTHLYHGCGVKEDGTGWCWGSGGSGQLGDGLNTSSTNAAVQVSNVTNFKEIEVGSAFSCGLTTDSDIYCWGFDFNEKQGNGPGSSNNSTPSKILGSNGDYIDVDLGPHHGCGVKSDGTAWCWGLNTSGQLGDNTTTTTGTPVQVANITDFIQISTGHDHSCGVVSDGTGYCWGRGDYFSNGPLGNGTTNQFLVPEAVVNVTNFVKIEAGRYRSCGLTSDSEIYCWGSTYLGDGTTTRQLVPTKVNHDDYVDLDVGNNVVCGIRSDFTTWCWGSDVHDSVGNGSGGTQATPFQTLNFPTQKVALSVHNPTSTYGSSVLALTYPLEHYNVQTTIEQEGAANDTVGSLGWVNKLESDVAGEEAGVGFMIDRDAAISGTVSASITAMREDDPGRGSLSFKTYDGTNLNDAMYMSWLGHLGIGITHGDSSKHYSYLQMGDHFGASWDTTYQHGMLATDNSNATGELSYFGFKGSNDASAAMLYSKNLKFQSTNTAGTTVTEYMRFDDTFKTTFFGTPTVQNDATNVRLRHKSLSAVAAESPDLEFTRYRGSTEYKAAASDADMLGTITMNAYDGTSTGSQAAIWGIVNGAVAATDVPADIVIGTDAAGDATANERMRVTSAGNVGIGTTSPTALLHSGGRIESDEGVRVGTELAGGCAVTADTNTIRYTGNTTDAYEYCDGTSWLPLEPFSDSCSPIPFDLKNVTNVANSTQYQTEEFIVGGLGKAGCKLTASTDSAALTIVLNGVDQTGTIIDVVNGDRISLKIDSGASEGTTVTTYVSLGDKTDEIKVTTLPVGYFVISSIGYNGGLGGLTGANETCFNEVDGNAWLNKPTTITRDQVKAFLCDTNSCNNLWVNTKYYFAIAGNGVNGGDSFTTDALGTGPGDSNNWNVAGKFNAPTNYWSNRAADSGTVWGAAPTTSHCVDWTDNTAGQSGERGNTNSTDGNRWITGSATCDNVHELICIVNPE